MDLQNEDETLKSALDSLLRVRNTLPNTPAGLGIRLSISRIFYKDVPDHMIPQEVRADFRHFNQDLVAQLAEGLR